MLALNLDGEGEFEKEVVPDVLDGGFEGNSTEASRPSEENIQEVIADKTL